MRTLIGIAAVTILCSGSAASGTNSVRVETLSFVPPGSTNVRIGVYFENSIPISAVALPLEIRTCSGGAYLCGSSFSIGLNPTGRMNHSPLGPLADPDGHWQGGYVLTRTFANPTTGNTFWLCPRSQGSNEYWTTSAPIDFVSPDAIFFASVGNGDPSAGEQVSLLPGSDPDGVPSFEIAFNVGQELGVFVIDTTCVTPSNDLAFLSEENPQLIKPTFQIGAVGVGVAASTCAEVPCQCPCHSNAGNCGGTPLGILDVVSTIDIAFRGVTPAQTHSCPIENTDLDCSQSTDVVDVVISIDVEFRGADPALTICEPCSEEYSAIR